MARIRTIKPEFWDSPSTARASLRARLFFIAMWNWTGAGEQRNRGTEEQGTKTLAHPRSETQPNRFDEFWDTYSHKVGRKKAEAAYRAAVRKPGVTDDLLIAAAAAYITWQMSEGKHPTFTKHPATWLTGEHWRDERPAHRPAQAPHAGAPEPRAATPSRGAAGHHRRDRIPPMSPADAAKLLTIASAYDNRKPDADQARAWALILDDIRFEDAQAVVVEHFRRSRTWLMPVDIIEAVGASGPSGSPHTRQ
jgi:hypothetical protein